MPILYLTIFISLILAAIFLVCFVFEVLGSKSRGTDHTALLPLMEDDEDQKQNHTNTYSE